MWHPQPASPRSRAYVEVDKETGLDHGLVDKVRSGRDAYRMSRLQMIQNVVDSRTSDVKDTIFGRAGNIDKPILYPQVSTTH